MNKSEGLFIVSKCYSLYIYKHCVTYFHQDFPKMGTAIIDRFKIKGHFGNIKKTMFMKI